MPWAVGGSGFYESVIQAIADRYEIPTDLPWQALSTEQQDYFLNGTDGDKVYVAYYHDGIRIVDMADPTQPREVGHYNDWIEDNAYGGAFEGALAVRKVSDLLYVADLERGLLILREQ